MANKLVRNDFSIFVEKYKSRYKFNSYIESLIDIIEARLFKEIDFDNVYRFISDSLKDKIFLEANNKNLIENKFKRKYTPMY